MLFYLKFMVWKIGCTAWICWVISLNSTRKWLWSFNSAAEKIGMKLIQRMTLVSSFKIILQWSKKQIHSFIHPNWISQQILMVNWILLSSNTFPSNRWCIEIRKVWNFMEFRCREIQFVFFTMCYSSWYGPWNFSQQQIENITFSCTKNL